MEKCIGCELCAGVCPAKCIYVRGADNPSDAPVSPGERYGFVYEINYLRCIHCDLCVEACPTEAITETKLFEFSFTNRADAIYTKRELLVDDEGRAQRQPWELWLGGEDDETSVWMRATSPSGAAAYEGRVGWSGELGFGTRDPEQRPDVAAGRSRQETASDGGPLLHLRGRRAGRRSWCRARPQPGALGAVPRAHARERRRVLPARGRAARRRGPDHRVRGRDRRPLPVRDHASRRRQARGARATRSRSSAPSLSSWARSCWPRSSSSPVTSGQPARRSAVTMRSPAARRVATTSSASPESCSPTSSGRSRSRPRCS